MRVPPVERPRVEPTLDATLPASLGGRVGGETVDDTVDDTLPVPSWDGAGAGTGAWGGTGDFCSGCD